MALPPMYEPPSKMTTLKFALPRELLAKVRAAAAAEGARQGRPMSVSQWAREALAAKVRAEAEVGT